MVQTVTNHKYLAQQRWMKDRSYIITQCTPVEYWC